MYEHNEGSKLRKILEDGWCEFEDKEKLQDRRLLNMLPKDFLVDAWIKHRVDGVEITGHGNIGGCGYHEHE